VESVELELLGLDSALAAEQCLFAKLFKEMCSGGRENYWQEVATPNICITHFFLQEGCLQYDFHMQFLFCVYNKVTER